MNEVDLSTAVERLAKIMQGMSDETLGEDWTWGYHDEGLRFALLGTYHELRDLAVSLAVGRGQAGRPITTVQHILSQYHAACRDLQAVLLGVGDDDLDRPPAEGEWPLREVLGHMIGAERRFFALVYFAVEQQRAGEEPDWVSAEQSKALLGPLAAFEDRFENASLGGIQNYHAGLHSRILTDLADWSDEDLGAPSRFWEDELMTVHYRLHRFDAHLRQHTVQAEKTLSAIGHTPNEAKRLLRLVYNALAEVEGAVIGAWDFALEKQHEATGIITARAEEVANYTGPS